jgi:hypothetical protein
MTTRLPKGKTATAEIAEAAEEIRAVRLDVFLNFSACLALSAVNRFAEAEMNV